MAPQDADLPLDRISTLWSLVCQANEGQREAATAAQQELMKRYRGAVYRHLLLALRDPAVADDLAQEFALRFIQGDFRGADRERGRFRDFVKGVLRHLVVDHYRRRRPAQFAPDAPEPAGPESGLEHLDREFRLTWRNEILARTWDAIEGIERRTGQPLHTVLRLRADNPEVRSAQLAEMASARLGRPVTAEWARQALHRGRDKFADLLLTEVANTLETASVEALEAELAELELLEYCHSALDRYRAKG